MSGSQMLLFEHLLPCLLDETIISRRTKNIHKQCLRQTRSRWPDRCIHLSKELARGAQPSNFRHAHGIAQVCKHLPCQDSGLTAFWIGLCYGEPTVRDETIKATRGGHADETVAPVLHAPKMAGLEQFEEG